MNAVFRDGTESWRDANGTGCICQSSPWKPGSGSKQLLSEQNLYDPGDQGAFGFENPQAIYKWVSGKSLPSLDNFVILSRLLHTSIENILVIDGDIPRLGGFLNQRFNDFLSLPPYIVSQGTDAKEANTS